MYLGSDHVRQVTFSAGQRRQVVGEYAHFWSFRRVSDARVDAVVVTSVYARRVGWKGRPQSATPRYFGLLCLALQAPGCAADSERATTPLSSQRKVALRP